MSDSWRGRSDHGGMRVLAAAAAVGGEAHGSGAPAGLWARLHSLGAHAACSPSHRQACFSAMETDSCATAHACCHVPHLLLLLMLVQFLWHVPAGDGHTGVPLR